MIQKGIVKKMKKYEYHDVNLRGTIEKVTYMTTNQDGEPRDKYANVYLPYGYDAADKEKKYNILYVMHGGGGSPDAWLDCCKVKNMLDYSIDTGEIKPLIVVFPSFYKEKISRIGKADAELERRNVMFFQKELGEELLPAVEKVYHTYAEDVTKEALKASRMHRGFGGFSMGSCTTWFAFMNYLDYFSEFVPLSGDFWAIEVMGGKNKPVETVKLLHDSAIKSGYGTDEYFIYTATGTKDAAFDCLNSQVCEMKKHPDTFVYEDDFSKGNFHYLLGEGQVHAYEAVYQYLYNFLPYLFNPKHL
jgi:enterochelin esterase-like enzyme